MSRGKPIPAKNRRIVEERCGGRCEGCGEKPAAELHHRKYRSRSGGNEVENLIALCGFGNNQKAGCHGTAHSGEGAELGWSVHSWHNPAHVPVLYRGVMRWLTSDGRTVDVGEEPPF